MASEVLTDAFMVLDELDLSGQSNSVALDYDVEILDETVFGNSTRVRKGGLFTLGMNASGFVDLADDGIDEKIFDEKIDSASALSLVPQGESEGNPGYTFVPNVSKYDLNLQHGALYAFEMEATNKGAKLVRGTLLGQETAASSSSASTARQLGAVSASQSLYASLHVISVSGGTPTLDAVVRSDDNAGMTTPTSRITFTQATAPTAEHLSLAGAITDDYFEINFTIGGSTPVFRFVVLVGIA